MYNGVVLCHSNEGFIISPCSAGVGRTGTLMAIDMTLEQAAQENVVDIPAIVTKMRKQRMKMVQNSVRSSQLIFILEVLIMPVDIACYSCVS